MAKKIAPAAIQCLKDALTNVYWYKSELRSFLLHTLSDHAVLARLNWEDYKRNIVATLIDHLARNEDVYQRDLICLMDEVSRVDDFSHLERLEEGKQKADAAKKSVTALRKQMVGFKEIKRRGKRSRTETSGRSSTVATRKCSPDEIKGDHLGVSHACR